MKIAFSKWNTYLTGDGTDDAKLSMVLGTNSTQTNEKTYLSTHCDLHAPVAVLFCSSVPCFEVWTPNYAILDTLELK